MTQFTTAALNDFFDMLQPDNRFIGMDNMFDRLHRGVQYHDTNFPVYNVIHDHKKETYTIEIALAGYKESDIDVTLDDQTLIVKGDKGEDDQNYFHKGIAYRKFEKRWTLGEFMVVDGASFEDGLLKIGLSKVIPDEKKPRTIEINGKKSKKSSLLKG
jgi:molecular chaperone IbpA